MGTMPSHILSRWFAGIGDDPSEDPDAGPSPDQDARVRSAVNALPVCLFETDREGIYTSLAGGIIELFGVRPARLLGRSIFDFPKFVPGKNMMVRRALAGEQVSFGGIWPRGRFIMQLMPRFDAERRVCGVVGFGFNFRKPSSADADVDQLLEALRQSEARFRTMCESAPLGIYVSSPRHELGYVNPALCALLGKGPAELLGQRWDTLLGDADRAALHTACRAHRDAPLVHEAALQLARSNGRTVWVSSRLAPMRDDGELIGYVGVILDVTQEHAAREAIARSQRDLRRVIESSPEGIAVLRDERWVFANRALLEALGYARAGELIGRAASEIVHPDDRLAALALGSSPQTADPGELELRYRKASGEYACMEIRAAALSEFEGAPALLVSARDITERKRLQAQLLVSERLLSVGTLAAGVAHEINNPLGAVLSNLEWIAGQLDTAGPDRPAELPPLRKALDDAREAAGRVRAIVRDLTLFSRIEDEAPGPADLVQVLDSALRLAGNELLHRARLVRDYHARPLVQGNEARLGQVFLNLIINAAHAIAEGRADEHEVRVSVRQLDSRRVAVEVRDTGCGIPAKLIGRIFDPFFTTKPAGIGTGLGLSICQRIVTGVGGRIEVESDPGRGSTFRVVLLQAEAPPPSARAQPPPAANTSPIARGRVLVIDDDPRMASSLELVLSHAHDVDCFTRASDALRRLDTGQRYDAIVCDVMMPEMSGMDFHAALARTQPELANQIIFLTGGAFTLPAREFLGRISNPRLDKPFESRSLLALIAQRLERVHCADPAPSTSATPAAEER